MARSSKRNESREMRVVVPMMLWLSPDNPFRPPDYRSLYCCCLIERGRAPRAPYDDPLTKDAWTYLRGLHHCRTAADCQRLERRFPLITEAYDFHATATPLRRAEL